MIQYMCMYNHVKNDMHKEYLVMNKIKDFFYNKNDIIIVLIILIAAGLIIYTRINAIMPSVSESFTMSSAELFLPVISTSKKTVGHEVRIAFDTGHANLYLTREQPGKTVVDWLRTAGARIGQLHIQCSLWREFLPLPDFSANSSFLLRLSIRDFIF